MPEPGRDITAAEHERRLIAAARRDTRELAAGGRRLPFQPGEVAGYVLLREIGRGGMGVVYEAEQQQPRRVVALKMIRDGALGDDHGVLLFQREVQALARLRHPAIAAIFEAGQTAAGRPFFVMELVRGAPLTEYARLAELSLRARLQLFGRLCQAVHYAHQRGVIHRDLKPANIIIDADGNPKILDFGLARLLDSEGALRTGSIELGKIVGTLAYMSPEQTGVRPEGGLAEIDTRSDVYSLGVMLYELLTGRLPYDVHDRAATEAFSIIREQAPRKPGTLDRALRGDLETIALKALAKDPGRRYDSAAALARDIERYLANQPIAARPPSTAYLLSKWIVRRRAAFTFATGMFLTVSFFLVVLAIQSAEVARARASIQAMQQPTAQSAEWAAATAARQLEELADARMGQGDWRAAEELLRVCREIRADVLGPAHWLTAYTESLLGECLVRRQQFAEAEPLLQRSSEAIVADRSASGTQKLAALQRLIALYEVWDPPEAVAELQAVGLAESAGAGNSCR